MSKKNQFSQFFPFKYYKSASFYVTKIQVKYFLNFFPSNGTNLPPFKSQKFIKKIFTQNFILQMLLICLFLCYKNSSKIFSQFFSFKYYKSHKNSNEIFSQFFPFKCYKSASFYVTKFFPQFLFFKRY